MANQSIYERIIEKGHQDAQKILSSGEAQASGLINTLVKETEKAILSDSEKFKDKQNNRLKSKITEFEQLAKSATLAKKQQLLTEVVDKALVELNQIPDDSWKRLVAHLLEADQLTGTETIVASPNDHTRFLRLFASGKKSDKPVLLDHLNLLFAPKPFQLTLSNRLAPIAGGFFVVGNAFDIDHSYETLLLSIKDKHEAILAECLFEAGD